ncbi:hypothetical protein ACM61V_06080 [Sphingomonas sp. TX0543]|uniref:hypothetical protein n=1 Tax=Sphingomonas sp. TX0543 TaxID=3399682 RepID=UPI003AFB0250
MSNNDDSRAARLAEQLRANLKKRKQQARGKPASGTEVPIAADRGSANTGVE